MADQAYIEKSVSGIGIRAEFEPTAFVSVYHEGGKQKTV
mgnify:CR=1 FL=1